MISNMVFLVQIHGVNCFHFLTNFHSPNCHFRHNKILIIEMKNVKKKLANSYIFTIAIKSWETNLKKPYPMLFQQK